MLFGIMAHDKDGNESIEAVIRAARKAYVERFGEQPLAAEVNPMYQVKEVDGLPVRQRKSVRPHHAIVGVELTKEGMK